MSWRILLPASALLLLSGCATETVATKPPAPTAPTTTASPTPPPAAPAPKSGATSPSGALRPEMPAAEEQRLLESTWRSVLVVYHEIPLRYALNGAAGSDDLDGPVHAIANAQPFLFDEDALERAVQGIERLA